MENKIQKDLDFICEVAKFGPNWFLANIIDLEYWIDFAALYSKKHWLILIKERLDRIEKLE